MTGSPGLSYPLPSLSVLELVAHWPAPLLGLLLSRFRDCPPLWKPLVRDMIWTPQLPGHPSLELALTLGPPELKYHLIQLGIGMESAGERNEKFVSACNPAPSSWTFLQVPSTWLNLSKSIRWQRGALKHPRNNPGFMFQPFPASPRYSHNVTS